MSEFLRWRGPAAWAFLAAGALFCAADETLGSDREAATLKVEQHADRLVVSAAGLPVATYVFRDPQILRPYFTGVHAPGGGEVTRRHPPREGADPVDHADMHPGLWLAFGDINGTDFWRSKGKVQHEQFVSKPDVKIEIDASAVTFAVQNRYLAGGVEVCTEEARHAIHATKLGYLFSFDSKFTGNKRLTFGDQEEMGLGLRLATPLAVKGGAGTITNSAGGRNEAQVWGRQAEWCDYSAVISSAVISRQAAPDPEQPTRVRTGLLLVPHAQNFRRSWMHARDYGLLVANPFGEQAFTRSQEASQVEVPSGDSLRLRFGVWVYAVDPQAIVDYPGMAKEYHRLAGE